MKALSITKFEDGLVNEDAAIVKDNVIAVSDGAGGGGVFAECWSQYLVDNYGNVYYFHGDKPTKEYDMSDITQNVVGQIDPKEVEEAYRLLMDVNCYDSLDNEYPHSDIYIEPDNNGYRENGQNYWARLYKHKKDTYKAGEGFPLYSYDGNAMNLTSEKGKEVSAIVVSWFADEKYHEFDEYGKYRDAVDEE